MFDNTKSYAVFAKDVISVENIGKKVEKVQSFLYDGQYKKINNAKYNLYNILN